MSALLAQCYIFGGDLQCQCTICWLRGNDPIAISLGVLSAQLLKNFPTWHFYDIVKNIKGNIWVYIDTKDTVIRHNLCMYMPRMANCFLH